MKIIYLLVRTDIQRTNNDFFPCHAFQNSFVGVKLLLLRGVIAVFQIKKFAAKQPDAAGVIDKNITMADLKGTLSAVMEQLYGEGTKTRFRPHHFPFTEPSCEMDVQCHKCGGVGCPTCKGEGWIEILGAGMIHPKVLEMSGIDSEEYSGWAFGMGLERLAMGEYKIRTAANGSYSATGTILKNVFPGDLLPTGTPIVTGATALTTASWNTTYNGRAYTFTVYSTVHAYKEDGAIICKIIHKNGVRYLSSFETSTEFWNPKNLSTNRYLTWMFAKPQHLSNYPFITVNEI